MLTGRIIKVLVVDDSAVMRKLIPRILNEDKEIEVVATAMDGDFAIRKIEQLKPDVITLDIDMPRMDGISTLSHIVSKFRTPVLMLSSLTTWGASLTLKALEIGAVDFVCKPSSPARIGEMAEELISKVKAAARSNPISAADLPPDPPPVISGPAVVAPALVGGDARDRIVAIGASSGGPNALRYLLPRIPLDFNAGIVVVQHMPESFTAIMARWLDEICEIDVREARDRDVVKPGRVLIAPGNAHIRVKKASAGGIVVLEPSKPVGGHMPSVDVFFRSVAQEYGKRATAIIMTGMGTDGAMGIGEIKKAGGLALAQDRESCTVYGMPRAAIERGNIDKVVSLSELPSFLVSVVGRSANAEVSYGTRVQ